MKGLKKTLKNKRHHVDAILKELRPHRHDALRLPENIWQRVWQHFHMRVVIGAGILVVITAGLVVGAYMLTKPQSTRLVDYIPRDTWVYVEFNLGTYEWQYIIETAPHLANALNDFFITNGLDQGLLNHIDEIILIGGIDKKEEAITWSWLVKSESPQSLEPYVSRGTFIKNLTDHVIVFSKTNAGVKSFSSWTHSRRTKERDTDAMWRGEIDVSRVMSLIKTDHESQISRYALIAALMNSDDKKEFTITLNEGDVVIDAYDADKKQQKAFSQVSTTLSLSVPEVDVLVRQTDSAFSIAVLEGIIEKLPLVQWYWDRTQETLSKDYHTTWSTLKEALTGTVVIAIRIPENENELLSKGFSEVDSTRLHGVVDFENKVDDQQKTTLSEALMNFFARKHPERVVRELTDGTMSTELVVNPRVMNEQIVSNIPHARRFYADDSSDEMILLNASDRFMVSNNQQLFTDYILSSDNENTVTCTIKVPRIIDNGATAYFSQKALQLIPIARDFSGAVIRIDEHSYHICLLGEEKS